MKYKINGKIYGAEQTSEGRFVIIYKEKYVFLTDYFLEAIGAELVIEKVAPPKGTLVLSNNQTIYFSLGCTDVDGSLRVSISNDFSYKGKTIYPWTVYESPEHKDLKEKYETLKSNFPEGYEDRKITFEKCPVGHGLLTSSNWIKQSGCIFCKHKELKAMVSKVLEHMEQQGQHGRVYRNIERILKGE